MGYIYVQQVISFSIFFGYECIRDVNDIFNLIGIQMVVLSKQNDIVSLLKAILLFNILLGQLFLYSYAGDYLSSLSNNVCHLIYNCPWYEFSPSIVRNLKFIIMRTQIPFRLKAGRFYAMDIENFKNILKAFFSYFSLLRIVFIE